MAHSRGFATGMEFEFQNGTGAMDVRSPFAQVRPPSQRSFTKDSPSKKRAFDSPNKPLPPVPAWNTLYNTPRKMNEENIDDSSAGETPRSAADNSDATPDTKGLRSAQSRFDNASMPAPLPAVSRDKSSPTREKVQSRPSQRRDSLFGRLKNKLYYPGRGEVPRADYTQAMEKRVKKRRERELHRHVARKRRHSMSDYSGDDSERPRAGSGKHPPDADRPHWLSKLFTFIAQHPTVPHILSFYAQLMFNLFLLLSCAYLIYCFWAAVRMDVDKKSYEAIAGEMAEIAACAKQYSANRCEPETRMPALESVCNAWRSCMERDPARMARAKVSAHTFAEIFNAFVEPISYKAMVFTCILVFGCFAVSNFAFAFFRDKAAGYQQHYYAPPPPTPQRMFSNQDANGLYGTPWHQPPAGLEPQPSGGFDQIEGRGSPVRRLVYN